MKNLDLIIKLFLSRGKYSLVDPLTIALLTVSSPVPRR